MSHDHDRPAGRLWAARNGSTTVHLPSVTQAHHPTFTPSLRMATAGITTRVDRHPRRTGASTCQCTAHTSRRLSCRPCGSSRSCGSRHRRSRGRQAPPHPRVVVGCRCARAFSSSRSSRQRRARKRRRAVRANPRHRPPRAAVSLSRCR